MSFKRLYGELGERETADISSEEAAQRGSTTEPVLIDPADPLWQDLEQLKAKLGPAAYIDWVLKVAPPKHLPPAKKSSPT